MRLRYIRRIQVRQLMFGVPAIVFVLAFTRETLVLIVLVVAGLVWVESFVSLSIRIRRDERRESV